MKKGKMYVPKDVELRTEIIQLHHDMSVVGYEDRWKTTVIAQGCGQTLGLGLGQSKDIVVVIISLQREKR